MTQGDSSADFINESLLNWRRSGQFGKAIYYFLYFFYQETFIMHTFVITILLSKTNENYEFVVRKRKILQVYEIAFRKNKHSYLRWHSGFFTCPKQHEILIDHRGSSPRMAASPAPCGCSSPSIEVRGLNFVSLRPLLLLEMTLSMQHVLCVLIIFVSHPPHPIDG